MDVDGSPTHDFLLFLTHFNGKVEVSPLSTGSSNSVIHEIIILEATDMSITMAISYRICSLSSLSLWGTSLCILPIACKRSACLLCYSQLFCELLLRFRWVFVQDFRLPICAPVQALARLLCLYFLRNLTILNLRLLKARNALSMPNQCKRDFFNWKANKILFLQCFTESIFLELRVKRTNAIKRLTF